MKKLFISLLACLSVVGLSSCGEPKENATVIQGEKGDKGDPGVGITKITKVSSIDNKDEYMIIYSDGSSDTFEIYNGRNGENGEKGEKALFQIASGYLQIKYESDEIWQNVIALSDLTGKNGENGKDGRDGKDVVFQVNDNFIQWKYSTDTGWTNLISLSALTGADGDSVEFNVSNGFINWKYKKSSEWTNLISLESLTGQNGKDGQDGKEIILDVKDGFISWKYEGDNNWNNLVSLETLTGKNVEISANSDYIIWKYSNDDTWTNLVPLSELKGTNGKSAYELALDAGFVGTQSEWLASLVGTKGEDGREIILSIEDDYISWKYDGDSTWNQLISVSSLKGTNGKSAYELYKEQYGYEKSEEEWLVDLIDGKLTSGTKYTITFMSDDEIYTTNEAYEGKNIIRPTDPSKTGYTFLGWYDENDDYWVFNGYEAHKDLVLYAKWKYNESTITLDTNGGALDIETINCAYGSILTLPVPTREGYDFVGWYNGDTLVESGTWQHKEDVTLIAEWVPKQFTITLEALDGELDGESSINVTFDTEYSLPTCISSDEASPFAGWFTENDIRITDEEGHILDKTLLKTDTTLYAKYCIVIANVEDLMNINNNLSGHYMLINDIDFDGNQTEMIGSESSPFTGILDGNGHSIKNLYSNALVERSSGNNYGLFEYLQDATIKNLTIDSFYYVFNNTNSKTSYVGFIAAKSDNVVFDNVIIKDSILSITSTYMTNIGSFVGKNTNKIDIYDCLYDNSNITIIQKSGGTISGGFIGDSGDSSINNSYSNGYISLTTATTGGTIGGFLGRSNLMTFVGSQNNTKISITNTSSQSGNYSGFVGIVNDNANFLLCSNYKGYYSGFIGYVTSGKTAEFDKCVNYADVAYGFVGYTACSSSSNTIIISTVNITNSCNLGKGTYGFAGVGSYVSSYRYYASVNISYSFSLHHKLAQFADSPLKTETSDHIYYKSSVSNCLGYEDIEDKSILTKSYFIGELGWPQIIWNFDVDEELGYVVPTIKGL